jgi:hypothetical protein
MCNRCINPSAPLTNSTTEVQGQCKLFHRAGKAGYTGIQFKYVNRSNASANITDNLTSLGTLTVKAAIEYNSVIYPITFNGGAPTCSLIPGAEIWSDPIGITIPSSATFFERVLVLCSGGSFVRANVVTAGRSEGVEMSAGGTFTAAATTNGSAVVTMASTTGAVVGQIVSGAGIPANSTILSFVTNTSITLSANCTATASGLTLAWLTPVTDKVYSGTITAPANSVTSVYSAVAIRGLPLNGDYGSVVVLFDSLASGVGAATSSEDRGFADKAFSGLYGVCNVAVSGGTLAGWTSTADARYRRQIINDLMPSAIVGGSGGNDLNNVGVTAAQVIVLLKVFWAELKTYGCPIIAWTIPPRTLSSDSWSTYAGQTINSPNVNWESERLILNTYLRTQAVAEGRVDQVIDFAAMVEDGGTTQSGRWKTNGSTANLYTSDGAHPNDVQSGTATLNSCTTVIGSNVVTMSNTTGTVLGQAVSGTGVAFGSVITNIIAATSITLSLPCIASGTATLTAGFNAQVFIGSLIDTSLAESIVV